MVETCEKFRGGEYRHPCVVPQIKKITIARYNAVSVTSSGAGQYRAVIWVSDSACINLCRLYQLCNMAELLNNLVWH